MFGFVLLAIAFLAMALMMVIASRRPGPDQARTARGPWGAW